MFKVRNNFLGLLNQETHEELAERKGLHVVKLSPHHHYLPEIVASPKYSQLKKEDEITPKEVRVYQCFTVIIDNLQF